MAEAKTPEELITGDCAGYTCKTCIALVACHNKYAEEGKQLLLPFDHLPHKERER